MAEAEAGCVWDLPCQATFTIAEEACSLADRHGARRGCRPGIQGAVEKAQWPGVIKTVDRIHVERFGKGRMIGMWTYPCASGPERGVRCGHKPRCGGEGTNLGEDVTWRCVRR